MALNQAAPSPLKPDSPSGEVSSVTSVQGEDNGARQDGELDFGDVQSREISD